MAFLLFVLIFALTMGQRWLLRDKDAAQLSKDLRTQRRQSAKEAKA